MFQVSVFNIINTVTNKYSRQICGRSRKSHCRQNIELIDRFMSDQLFVKIENCRYNGCNFKHSQRVLFLFELQWFFRQIMNNHNELLADYKENSIFIYFSWNIVQTIGDKVVQVIHGQNGARGDLDVATGDYQHKSAVTVFWCDWERNFQCITLDIKKFVIKS